MLSVPIEALNLYTLLSNAGVQLGAAEGGPGVAAFGAVTAGLEESFTNQRRLHGRWAQDLFQAVVVSLDDVRLIKDEDAGTFYYDESGPALELPDFRVVHRDGEQILVDVKNVSPRSLFRAGHFRTQRLRASTVEAQRQYAKLTSGRLVYAHYWASFNIWTVIDSDVLHRVGNWFEVDMGTAMKGNEFSLLGDRVVITSAKLMLSLFRDSSKPATAEPETDDAIPFPVGAVRFTCDGQLLTDPVEREIAWYLFSFGSGEATVEVQRDKDEVPVRADVISTAPAGSDSPNVGSSLSSMYSARYIVATKEPDGAITRFGCRPDPRLARLIPGDYWDRDDHVLKLMVGHQQPNRAA
jgi:hypothetical protein